MGGVPLGFVRNVKKDRFGFRLGGQYDVGFIMFVIYYYVLFIFNFPPPHLIIIFRDFTTLLYYPVGDQGASWARRRL